MFDFGPVPPPPPKAAGQAQNNYSRGNRSGQSHRGGRGGHQGNSRGRGGYSYHRGGSNQRGRGGLPANQYGQSQNKGHGALYDARPPTASSADFGHRPLLKPSQDQAITGPSVPSFGFRPPQPVSASPVKPQRAQEPPNKKPRTTNTLGITPKGEDVVDSDEEADEADFINAGGSSAFGVEGIWFKNVAQLREWLAERKRNWPTAARREARERKRKEEELAKLRAKVENSRQVSAAKASGQGTKRNESGKKDHKLTSDNTANAFKATPQLKSALLGCEYESDSDVAEASASGDETDSATSNDTSSPSESDTALEKSADNVPEQSSSKPKDFIRVRTPLRKDSAAKQVPAPRNPNLPKGCCKHFWEKGFCKLQKAGQCRWKHEQPRLSLYEKVCARLPLVLLMAKLTSHLACSTGTTQRKAGSRASRQGTRSLWLL